jgi:hypothetical protein
MSWITVGVAATSAVAGGVQGKRDKHRLERDERAQIGADTERQSRIDMTRGQIDRAFDAPERQSQYAGYADAMREYLSGELIKQKRDASRNLKFALAKSGQTGGSQSVDANANLGEEFNRGALQNERQVQGDVANLRGQDQLSRNSLLNLADGGLDLTSAMSRSSTALSNNLGNASVTAMGQGLGDVFADTGKTYKAINERVAQRRGFGYKTNRKELYGS